MKKSRKFLYVILSVVILAVSVLTGCGDNKGATGETGEKGGLVFDESNIETYDLCAPKVRAFLNANTEQEHFETLKELIKSGPLDKQYLGLKLSDDFADYDVLFSETKDFKEYISVHTNSNILDSANYLKPGTKYYYKVMFEGELDNYGVIQTLDAPCRFVNVSDVGNMRDLGGWTTSDGRKVNYGKIYRSANLTINIFMQNMPAKKQLGEDLGIVTEMDVRNPKDNADHFMAVCKWDNNENNFVNPAIYSYLYNIPDSGYYQKSVAQEMVEAFECFGNEDRYPILFHCSAGADRTGCLAFILNGLLGVGVEDLYRDFELTTVSGYGSRTVYKLGETGFIKTVTEADKSAGASNTLPLVYEMLMNNYGGNEHDLAYAIEEYLLSLGVSQENINNYKDIMLN